MQSTYHRRRHETTTILQRSRVDRFRTLTRMDVETNVPTAMPALPASNPRTTKKLALTASEEDRFRCTSARHLE